HAPVGVLLLEEDAIAAAHDRLRSERTPGEAEPRRELRLVRARDGKGQARLAARLDGVLEEGIGGGARELGVQVDLIRLAGHDDRPRGEGIERAELAAVARRPWRIFVAEPEVQAEAAVHAEVVLQVEVPIRGLAAERIGGER